MELGTPTANRLYTAALDATRPDLFADVGETDAAPDGFADALTEAAAETVRTLEASETATTEMMSGRADAHSVVEALAAAEMALEMAVAVRNKVVEAYQEILRMPV